MWLYTCIIIATTCWLLYLYVTRNFDYWKKRNVPSLEPEFFFGNIRDAILLNTGMGELFQTIYNKMPSPYLGFFILHTPCMLIRDPELIRQITISDFQHFTDRTAVNNKRDDPVGSRILFALKNPDWKSMREKVRPIFSLGKLKNLSVLVEECASNLMAHLEKTVGDSAVFDVKPACMCYTVDTITSCCFGINANSFEKHSEFKRAAEKFFDWDDLWVSLQMRCYFIAPTLVKLFHMKLLHGPSTNFLKQSVLSEIKRRNETNQTRNDLIDVLMQLQNADVSFADEDILVAAAVNFFIAGYETTSATIAFGLYELAKHPECQEKLQEEVATLTEINFATVKDLPYLEMCVKEILRKYPSLPFLDRVCNAQYKIPNTEVVIEKDTKVFVSLLGLHYDPELFPNPDVFDPDRFLQKENLQGYFPFGNGPRFCIGDRFGLQVVKTGLCNILKKYNIYTTGKTPKRIVFDPRGVLLSSVGGVYLKLDRRS